MELTIGSLFSGIGGLELGLEASGIGRTVWQVEQNPFCRCVLRHHWPEAELFEDVRSVGASNLAAVDLVCGGFPCQDVSSAGTRTGLAGERSGLWREFARVVEEIRPGWVVVENVASGAGRWLDAVVRELEKLGYACLPLPIAARDVGAPHLRERLFIVANADDKPGSLQSAPRGYLPGTSADATELGGGTRRLDIRERKPNAARDSAVTANALHPRREGSGPGEQDARRKGLAPDPWWPPEPGLVPLVHGLSGGMAGRRRRARIRALGNTVVPQCAEVVGYVIRELIESRAA